jgi:hypothetical protein
MTSRLFTVLDLVSSLAFGLVPLLALSSAASAQTQVHVVDSTGAGEFTTIAAAIAAAESGDIVLLRAGDYFSPSPQGVVLDGTKTLAVVADSSTPLRTATLDVENVLATNHVLVQRLHPVTGGGDVDRVRNCAGPVWLEGCDFEHAIAGVSSVGGVVVDASASVVFARSTLRRPVDLFLFGTTAIALQASTSRVHLHGSTVHGVREGNPAALGLQGAFLELFGASLLGGAGTNGSPFGCNGGNGGDGLELQGASQASALGATIAAGPGGAPFGGCSPGLPGTAVVLGPGSALATIPGLARGFEVVSPVRDDELVQATFRGTPGDGVWLGVSSAPRTGLGARFRDGELLLATPFQVVFIGTIPASGSLVLQVPAPTLQGGAEGAVFFGQAIFRDATTLRFVMSEPSALVVIDDSL